jgi:hypothetical protein
MSLTIHPPALDDGAHRVVTQIVQCEPSGGHVSLTLCFAWIWQLAQGPGHVRNQNKLLQIKKTGKAHIRWRNAAA